jgi:hypothetical protein
MVEFLQLLRDILWLRRGPENMPYSPALLAGVCVADIALQWSLVQFLAIEDGSLPLSLIEIVIMLGFVYLILMTRGLQNRFVQAATALQCCSIVFTLLVVPALFVLSGNPKLATPLTPMQSLFALATLPVAIWKFVVDAHIFRHALSVTFARGLGVAAAWLALQWIVGLALHGAAQAH